HLRPRLGELLDVGFLGRWWLLEAALRDPDINEEEFGHLPPELRRVRRGELRSES
ncbi:TIM29 translocase, partial [Alaudala cheleensis]|nr:TIM29 translocase [Alaudala cheleensis]